MDFSATADQRNHQAAARLRARQQQRRVELMAEAAEAAEAAEVAAGAAAQRHDELVSQTGGEPVGEADAQVTIEQDAAERQQPEAAPAEPAEVDRSQIRDQDRPGPGPGSGRSLAQRVEHLGPAPARRSPGRQR